jgi:hypothetical protein
MKKERIFVTSMLVSNVESLDTWHENALRKAILPARETPNASRVE